MQLSDCFLPYGRSNPCDVCATHIARCPWLHKGKPVPGWLAIKKPLKVGSYTHKKVRYPVWVETYQIFSCPMFRPPKLERLGGER